MPLFRQLTPLFFYLELPSLSLNIKLFLSLLFILFFPGRGFSLASSIKSFNAKPNVLLITIDSLRPDHMGIYGYPLPTTPHIDKIASEGILFKNAFTQGGWTSPAMISVFTSMYPNVHTVEARPDRFPCAKNSLLQKWIEAGYNVPGVEKVVKENNYSNLGFQIRKDYAFDLVSLKNWIKKNRSKPFFSWYHINKTPHLPYNPEKPFDTLFLPKGFSFTPSIRTRLEKIKKNMLISKDSLTLQYDDIVPIKALYDGEVRMADNVVFEIYTFLAQEGLLDNTILVITADHGEELMDHGFIGHASTSLNGTLYNEIIHVPLILRYPPEFPKGKRQTVEDVVESIDIVPTLMEIAEVPGYKGVQGRSLLKLLRGKELSWKNYAFSETTTCGFQCKTGKKYSKIRIVSIFSSKWKFITRQEPEMAKFELYDLEKDPGEKLNVVRNHPEIAKMFKDLLIRWYYKNSISRKALFQSCFNRTR